MLGIVPPHIRKMNVSKRTRRCDAEEEDDTDEVDLEKGIRQIGNRVYFHSAVTREAILMLIQKLCAAENAALTMFMRAEDAFVLLFIHSEGGDAYAGLSGMNHIQQARVRIVTVADGFVASAATFLLLGGNKRYAMQHSCVLIHQVSGLFWGKYAELQDEMQNSAQLMQTLKNLYCDKTKMTVKKVNRMLKKELTLTAEQCVKFGVVDEMFNTMVKMH